MTDWKEQLKELITTAEEEQNPLPEDPLRVRGFISDIVVPAFEEIAGELQEYDRDVEVEFGERSASIRVLLDGKEEFFYEVKIRAYQKKRFAFPAVPLRDSEGQIYRAEIHTRDRPLHEDVTDCTKDDLIQYFLNDYSRRLKRYV